MNNITLTLTSSKLIQGWSRRRSWYLSTNKSVHNVTRFLTQRWVYHDFNYYSAIEIFFLKFREYFLKIVVFILLMLEEFSGVARIKAVRGDEYSVYRWNLQSSQQIWNMQLKCTNVQKRAIFRCNGMNILLPDKTILWIIDHLSFVDHSQSSTLG